MAGVEAQIQALSPVVVAGNLISPDFRPPSGKFLMATPKGLFPQEGY